MPYMPILCVDFDGVIHQYDTKISPWDDTIIPDGPVPGAFDFLEAASKYFEIHIYSSRSKNPAAIDAMKSWFLEHFHRAGDAAPLWFHDLHFALQKPAAFLTIDDRAFCFEGAWPDPVKLLRFKPWNKR